MNDSPPAQARLDIPLATYRLQLNRDFTFAQATSLVPYLHDLGISHCYVSPYLKARAGSSHGYDIVDHQALNPEIGSWEDLERFVDTLGRHGMGQILDIVPNHMAVGGDDNRWWLDVLENGQASPYAQFFDIDWRPIKDELRGKVLCPVLGDHYGAVLARGEIRLDFDEKAGAFGARYFGHLFPIDPKTYPTLLAPGVPELESNLGKNDPCLLEFESLISAFTHLPMKREIAPEKREERNRDKEILKLRLAQLIRNCPAILHAIQRVLVLFNGVPGEPASYRLLHGLLEQQAYRLSYWQVAADEVNYRRFFDINSLAGVRVERPEVFEATHGLVFALIGEGKVNGLRIDHPDGLFDPAGYYERLQEHLDKITGSSADTHYVVIEKILAAYESLREDWPVQGTTGYDFCYAVNGLFVQTEAERPLTRIYERFIGRRVDFDELLYQSKKLITRLSLTSELTVLANQLDQISESNWETRDFTLNELRLALVEIVACFPVYRTYVTPIKVSEEDRRYVDWAIAQAKKRSPIADLTIFDFIRRLLLLDDLADEDLAYRAVAADFAMRFQQYTAPVMAKGLEDTSFYIYNRLISLNEVGSDPRRFGMSVSAFHHGNQERLRRWPHSMLSTSTHDTKRGEDVRARINVLSELPEEWHARVTRWSRLNQGRKRKIEGVSAPDRNDEYLLYQTLIGCCPPNLDETSLPAFRERIEAYMLKAMREAKVHTSWIRPNSEYEQASTRFVHGLLDHWGKNPFLADFLPFQARIARLGMFNSLSQTILKVTAPGVPDLYQGTELWDFSLVDPDNRRPVDYALRHALLTDIRAWAIDESRLAERVRILLDSLDDGRAKLYLTWRALGVRRRYAEVFQSGEYIPLTVSGPYADRLCAFARYREATTVVTIAPRCVSVLMNDEKPLPLGTVWQDTRLELPLGDGLYYNALTGEHLTPVWQENQAWLPAHATLANFPVALLISQS